MIIIKCSFSWWTIRTIKVTFCFTLLFWILFDGNLCLELLWTRIWFYKCQLSWLGIYLCYQISVNIFFNNKQTVKRFYPWGKCYWFSEMWKNEKNNILSLPFFLRNYTMWNILREWCSSNICKIFEKSCKGVYFFSDGIAE